jgi:hypothetical protein
MTMPARRFAGGPARAAGRAGPARIGRVAARAALVHRGARTIAGSTPFEAP